MISVTLVGYFLFALLVSFCCSLFEATLLSVSPTHIESLRRSGRKSGQILWSLRDRVDRPLIAILTMNTVANMFGAAGVGNEAGRLARQAGATTNEQVWVTVASGVLTLAILIFSEIIPKTLGARYSRPLAPIVALPIKLMVTMLLPVVLLLQGIPKLLGGSGITTVTRDDLMMTAEMGRETGGIHKRGYELITNALKLDDVRTRDVLTPRTEMFSLHADMTASEVVKEHPRLTHSRIPVSSSADHFEGMVLRTDIHEACLAGKGDTKLGDMLKPIRYTPETQRLAPLLEELINREEHMVLVVDEHGSVEGLVTLEDVMETLLGVEILDELDTVADLQGLALMRAKARRRQFIRVPGTPKA
ncbi:MAG: CNNM domain-containing protein [Phycisphaerales bacterium JB065]